MKVFAADKIKKRAGDPFTIDYNVRCVLVRMRTAKSKKVRRFVWQEPLGSDLGGYWRETDFRYPARSGFEPRRAPGAARRVAGALSFALIR